MGKTLLNDMKQLTKFCHTGSLENFHAVILKWAPKRVHFSYNGMRARVQLACLSHNANIGRAHAKTKEGVLRYRLEYTKSTKHRVAKKLHDNVLQLLEGPVERCAYNHSRHSQRHTAPAQPHAPEHSTVLCHCICQLYQIVHAAALVQSMRPPENTNIARVKNNNIINRVCQLFSTFCMHMYQ